MTFRSLNCTDCKKPLPRIRRGGVCYECMERQLRQHATFVAQWEVPGRSSDLTSREQLDRPSLSQHWYEDVGRWDDGDEDDE